MRELVDIHYPDAECIRVVQDNLSTHSPALSIKPSRPAEARRILRRLEFHFTPKHALGVIFCRAPLGDLDLAPRLMHVEDDEELTVPLRRYS
jgi:hypothetical protein